jgi:hypothetical protein
LHKKQKKLPAFIRPQGAQKTGNKFLQTRKKVPTKGSGFTKELDRQILDHTLFIGTWTGTAASKGKADDQKLNLYRILDSK